MNVYGKSYNPSFVLDYLVKMIVCTFCKMSNSKQSLNKGLDARIHPSLTFSTNSYC